MKHIIRILLAFTLLFGSLQFTGCASLVEEDENTQQTPWAGPADWEGTIPGMPNQR